MKIIFKNYLFLLFLFIGVFLNAQITIPNVLVDKSVEDGECTISINRKSPSNILAGANPDIIYRSSDGGLSWTKTNLSSFSSGRLIGDVTIATDGNTGNFYFQTLDEANRFHAMRSSDFGASWNSETIIGDENLREDKNWLFVDNVPDSPYNGNLYCVWTSRPRYNNPGHIFFCKSVDKGITWSEKDTLDTDSIITPIGASIAVGNAGEIYVSWGGGSPNRIKIKKSEDGGETWPTNYTILDSSVQPKLGYFERIDHAISYSAQYTSLACDISGGEYNGNLYCVWEDLRNGDNNADVFLAKSTDCGESWTTQKINNDITKRNQVLPTVAVDPTSGWVYVSYLDARLNTDDFDDTLHYYLAWSKDGGQTFHNIQVSQNPSTISKIHSDYMGMDAFAGKVHLLWASGSNNKKRKRKRDAYLFNSLQIWSACVTQTMLLKSIGIYPFVELYPIIQNKEKDFISVDFRLFYSSKVACSINNLYGKEVVRLLDNKIYTEGKHQLKFDTKLASGFYIVTIKTPFGSSNRKVLLIE